MSRPQSSYEAGAKENAKEKEAQNTVSSGLRATHRPYPTWQRSTHQDGDGRDSRAAGRDERVEEVQCIDGRFRREFLVLRAASSVSRVTIESNERTHVFNRLQGDLLAEEAEVEDGCVGEKVEHGCTGVIPA